MSFFMKHMVIQKLKQVRSEELLDYAQTYEMQISREEAEKIVTYLQTNEIDPFDAAGREEMFRKLAQITSPTLAKKANALFQEIIRSQGVEHLFR